MIKQNVIMIFKTNCYKININVMKRRKMKEIHMKQMPGMMKGAKKGRFKLPF